MSRQCHSQARRGLSGVAAPGVVESAALVPVSAPPSVAVIVYDTPATVEVVNVTVALPFASVVLVADENEPPLPVFDQVTILRAVATGLFLLSAS